MPLRTYLLSLPERLIRSVLGLSAGVAREVGEVTLPEGVRQSRLYQNLVDATLRFLIEDVGRVEGVYDADGPLPENFLPRRTLGNAIEALGVVAFRASPVWVLAALADVCGAGRQLIPDIAAALKAEGLLDGDTEFSNVEELLDGLERTSARLAKTINTPPLDVAALREEWRAIKEDARGLHPGSLPSREGIRHLWEDLKVASTREKKSVFETSSMMAISAARALPGGVRWLAASARVGAARTGEVFATALLDHYRQTLTEIRDTGYAAYAGRQLRPYLKAAANQFSPAQSTVTGRAIDRLRTLRKHR